MRGGEGQYVLCEFTFLFHILLKIGMSNAVAININNTDTRFTRKSRGFLHVLFLP